MAYGQLTVSVTFPFSTLKFFMKIGAGIVDNNRPSLAAPPHLSVHHKKKKDKKKHKISRHSGLGDASVLDASDWDKMHDPSTDYDSSGASMSDYAEATGESGEVCFLLFAA